MITQPSKIEPLWHVQLAVAAAIGLYLVLPSSFISGPRWLVPLLEVVLLIALVATTPRQYLYESPLRRAVSYGLIGLVSVANIVSLVILVNHLLGGGSTSGRTLILASIEIYLTNIIIFALWYWEMDRGGPGRRSHENNHQADFLFPQMSLATTAAWRPAFMDYLYVSATNATAFSPTDTMPLSHQAKLLMLVQALVSLITIALVAARAVNILS